MIVLFILMIIGSVLFALIYLQGQRALITSVPAEVLAYHAEGRRYFQDLHSPTVAELAAVLRAEGFEEAAEAVEGAWAPCFRLVATADEDASATSRIGGLPDLPDVARWPRWNGVPLAFLAQLDLGELAALNPETPLPQQGLLLFFYDADQRTSGLHPDDRDSWRVLYVRAPFTPVSFDVLPEGLPEHAVYAPVPVFVENGESLPDDLIDTCLEGHPTRARVAIDDIMDQYVQFYEAAAHQVLGFPYTIHGDMRVECALASNGLDSGDESVYQDARARDLIPGAADWHLLFQIDTDDRADMNWGDGGTVYFWIRHQDLAEARFDRVWMILQSA